MSQSTVPESGPLNLFRPLLLLFYSTMYIIPTIIHVLLSGDLTPFGSLSSFQNAWFARFWSWLGPRSTDRAAVTVVPLLRHAARGVCLDIGPGTGQWVHLFARAHNERITKIYGVEPNRGMHAELRANVVRAGLGEVYEIVGCGAEELGTKGGLGPGSVETIVTVQCLCSIPTPELVIRELYPLLKSGGKWLVFEHVKTKYLGEFVEYWQKVVNFVWPTFFNGCDITRPTDEWLLRAGDWEDVQLGPVGGEGRSYKLQKHDGVEALAMSSPKRYA